MSKLALILPLLTLTACVPGIITIGNNFDLNKAETLPKGTSVNDAINLIGPPTGHVLNPDGTLTYQWSYAANGFVGAHGKRIDLLFDKDKNLITITTEKVIN